MGWRWYRGRFVTDQEFYRMEEELAIAGRGLWLAIGGFVTMWAICLTSILLVATLISGKVSDSFSHWAAFFCLIPAWIFRGLGSRLFILVLIGLVIWALFF